MTLLARTLAGVLATAGALGAQSPVPVVLEGDALPDGGRVTGIRSVTIDYYGMTTAVVTTDLAAFPEMFLVEDFSGTFVPGLAVGSPAPVVGGATIAAVGTISPTVLSNVVWTARLAGTPGGAADDEVVYYGTQLWLREGPVARFVPMTNLPPGTRWLSFADARASTASGFLMLRGRIDDPEIGARSESFLGLGWIGAIPSQLVQLDRLVSQGQLAPTLGRRIASVRPGPAAAAIAPSPTHIVWTADLAGDESDDGVVFRYNRATDTHQLIAREGEPSPVPGRTWGPLEDVAVDVASGGTWFLRATLDASDPATDEVLVRNGFVLVREGDSPAAVSPDVITGFGRGAVLIGDDGTEVWSARLDGPSGPSTALFAGSTLVARTGVTQVAGRTLVGIRTAPDSLSLSPLGDSLLFTGTLAGGLEGAFRVDLDP